MVSLFMPQVMLLTAHKLPTAAAATAAAAQATAAAPPQQSPLVNPG